MSESAPRFSAYCHIDEFGEHGLGRLPQMIAFCEPITLWSPSFPWMEANGSPIESEKLLNYIEKGHVRVVGRKRWITDTKFRNDYDWKFAHWTDYDQRLRELYYKDLDKYGDSSEKRRLRRVVDAPNETGAAYAAEQMKNPDGLPYRAARELLTGDIPKGFAAKRDVGKGEQERIEILLRNSRNHARARIETDSDLIVFPHAQAHWLFMNSEQPSALPKQESTEKREETEKLLGAGIAILKDFKTFPTTEILDEFLKKNYRNDLVDWLDKAGFLYSSVTDIDAQECMKRTIALMINEGLLQEKKGWKGLIPKTRGGRVRTALAFVSAAVFIYAGQLDPLYLSGLALDAIKLGRAPLEMASKIPLSGDRYRGPQALFIGETGKKATLTRVYKVLEHLGLPKPPRTK